MRTSVLLDALTAAIVRSSDRNAAFEKKVAELLRAGLPGQSMSDGRGGGQGIPGFDKVDRELRRAQKARRGHLRRALVELLAAEKEELALLIAPAVVEDPQCANDGCENRTDGVHGKCGTCRNREAREKAACVPAKGDA